MSFGVMGGNMQPQAHVQTLVRMLAHRQQPQAACDAPRWRFNEGLEINVEATMSAATVAGLASAATASTSSTTATRTSAPASSSGASATRRSRATSPRATRAATARPPAGEVRRSDRRLGADHAAIGTRFVSASPLA